MSFLRSGLFTLLALLFSGCVDRNSNGITPASRFLFNGRNLVGWEVMHGGSWTVEKGELVARNGVAWSTNPKISGSWLRTDRPQGDFILELDYSVNVKGNSGVFIRSGLELNPAFTGHEIQILDDAALAKPEKWSSGALYDVVAANQVASRPAGEWNSLRIEARGPRVQIQLNGIRIVDYPTARSLRGYIGLQNHDTNAVTRFRNIRLTDL